ncbi:acyltransferase family protein [Floridanema evergladense]|uniref:Acyltransferase family protein n=1 Tax=Floridaenema evergladense BLCC-F167 TaxID=3153639 RepID=A0ABV4WW97_9CYAN
MTLPPVNLERLQNANESASDRNRKQNIEGFDFLRAIFSVVIVALKTRIFVLGEIFVSATFAYALMAKVAYLAVPVFLQMSLFLFYLKSEKLSFVYFLKKRLPRLILLYVFWVGTYVLFEIVVKGNSAIVKGVTSSTRSMIEFIISGGQSPFFFLFSLIFLTTLAAIVVTAFKKIENESVKHWISYALLFVCALAVFSFSLIPFTVTQLGGNSETGITHSISSIVFWDYNPFCFLPYLFTSLIVIQDFNSGKLEQFSSSFKVKLCTILALFIGFTIIEFHTLEKLLHYSRISLLLGSWLLLYLALLSPLKASPIVKFIASCSLGIYAFHVLLTGLTLPIIGNNEFFKNIFETVPGSDIVLEFVVVLTGSIALSFILKKIKWLKTFV